MALYVRLPAWLIINASMGSMCMCVCACLYVIYTACVCVSAACNLLNYIGHRSCYAACSTRCCNALLVVKAKAATESRRKKYVYVINIYRVRSTAPRNRPHKPAWEHLKSLRFNSILVAIVLDAHSVKAPPRTTLPPSLTLSLSHSLSLRLFLMHFACSAWGFLGVE